MTIKRKMFTVVLGELIMFLAIIAAALLMLLPALRLNTEFAQLSELSEQVQTTRLSIIGIVTSPMEIQYEDALVEKAKLTEKFAAVADSSELGGINENVSSALGSILKLEEMFNERWVVLEDNLLEVMEYSEQIMFTKSAPLLNFYKAKLTQRVDDFNYVMERVDSLERNISITDGALNSAYDVIITQDGIISAELSHKIRSIIIRTIIIFIMLITVIIITASIVVGRMVRSISALSEGVSDLRRGKLDTRFSTLSNDDIALLGENLNDFTGELSISIRSIKESSHSNVKMKNELSEAAVNVNSSSEGITRAVGAIREGMVDLDSKVAESGAAVTTVNSTTDQLKGMLEEQTAMIEESTSAVTEMIASVDSVSDITARKTASTEQLVKTAETGGNRLDQTISIIQDITSNLDEIRGTVSIIQTVSAQTNLLAMNAAIEAAHAGDAGAGFSVVAEEIRKLAEASGASSKQIGTVLKDVVGSIEKAAASGDDTKQAFTDINREVTGVAQALNEIKSSMDELSAGGSQILDAMTSLQGFTAGVKDGGDSMADAAGNLEDAFRIVERVSSGVLSQIGGISSQLEEITNAAGVVSGISRRLNSEAEKLEAEVERFSLNVEVDSVSVSPAETDEVADLQFVEDAEKAAGTELFAALVVDEAAD
ncbi:MAG: methyl-accepting chemotaxis protein [Spirochaetales bacterium]|uniref:Methyl-accepting chemotaxis protein n=1 Tax=Candidatus Thalassospirochaeta sargassi TaxID=3119039 RepID=A0AAJ1ICU0_9SPIO|nr:methyl-accepting chemotaxis protein [Spirochaetales bacterium]